MKTISYNFSRIVKSTALVLAIMMFGFSQLQAQNVAQIGSTEYATLDEAIAEVQTGETIEIIASACTVSNTAVIPSGVTITGQGKTSTTMTIASTSGSGLTLNNANVTLSNMTIDGSQITSGGYKTLVNVRADGCLITDVVMTGGGHSTWNSSILVETLPSTATFTVSNSTISGAFRGVLRESCSANIVINNCDITATYPFNIDGGNGGTVTVTGGALHGWTSYSGVDQVIFTDVTFSKGSGSYNVVAAYVNTTFNNCDMEPGMKIYAQTSGFNFTLNDCEMDGQLITNQNFTELFPADPDVWNKCLTTVNEVTLVSKQAQVTEVLTGATTDKYAMMTKSFEYNGALCGPASDKTLNLNCNDSTLIMKNNGTQIASLTSAGGKYTLEYACEDGSMVSMTNVSVAISEGTAFTVTDQTTFFTAAEGYYLVETDNGGSYTYSVGTLADKVACIGDGSLGTQYFTTLADAVTAASAATDTIVILQDIADLPQQTIDKNISINLNNHTLSGSTSKLINITAGDVTIKNGNITSTATRMIDHASTGTLNINDCVLSGVGQMVYAENGTVNANNSTLSGANFVIYSTNCIFNAIDCNIRSTATAIQNTTGSTFYLENCNVTAPAVAISNAGNAGAAGVMKINGGEIRSTSYGSTGTIYISNGSVDIYGDTKIYAYYRAIEATTNEYAANSIVVNFGGYMDGGNLVASGAPSIILRDTTVVPAKPYAIDVWYASTINIFGDATITANNQNVTAAIGLVNGGTANITGGTIETYNDGVLLGNWVYPDGNVNTLNVSDSAFIQSTHGETVNNTNTYPSEVEIWGGTFSDDVSGEMCRDGYAAFANGTTPETYTVVPSYTVYYSANNGTTEKDTVYVRQTELAYTVEGNSFTNGSLIFSGWNIKADGTGANINPGATMTLTHDTTLYAQWRGVAKIGDVHYSTLNEAAAAVPVGTPTTITILQNLNFYDITGSNLTNKTITFTGAPTDTLTLTTTGHTQTAASGADLTFENITLKNDNSGNYRGIIHLSKLTLSGCEILGFMNGYAETFICNNCTFTQSTGEYSLWSYGSHCTFNSCVFNGKGKTVNIYTDQTTYDYRMVTFNDCAFNADPAVTGKSALQINSRYCCFIVNVNNCTVSGFTNTTATAVPGYENLVNNKKEVANTNTTLNVDGVQVLRESDCGPVAKIGGTFYTSLQAALDAAYEMNGDVTIELVDDITGYSIVHQKAGLNVTIEGNDHTVAGQIIVDGDGRASGTETLTIQNVAFNDDGSHFCSGLDGFIMVPSTKTTGTPYYTGKYNYAHNITISDCSFTSTSSSLDVVGFKANSGAGNYNTVLNHVIGDNLHSLAQFTGTTGATITNDTITNSQSFVNVNGGGGNFTISNCSYTGVDPSDGYAVRENGSSSANITLTNNSFSANKVLVLGKNGAGDPTGTINVESGNYNGVISKETVAGSTAIFSFTGGTFDQSVATVQNWCAEGYGAFDDHNDSPHTCTVYPAATVHFDANGGEGTMADTIVKKAEPYRVPECQFTPVAPYNFAGWKDATDHDYNVGDFITLTSDTTLIAQWSLANTITYHSNYGTDITQVQTKLQGETVVLYDATAFAWTGHDLIGWNTQADGNGTPYDLGADYSDNANLVLYAVWQLKPCDPVTDYDGNEYQAVRLGSTYVCWTTQNLRSTHYYDGTEIPGVMQYPAATRAVDPNGNLYTQDAALRNDGRDLEAEYSGGGIQGVCPDGWRLPTQADMEALMAGEEVPELLTDNWLPMGGSNSSGLSLLPSGYYNPATSSFEDRGVTSIIWLGTPASVIYHACKFGAACGTYELVPGTPGMGCSVRCVKD